MKKFFIVAIILLYSQLNVLANETQKVYLAEAIEIALQNNIDLEANKIDLTIAKNKIFQANRLQNPTLDYYYFMA